MVNGVYGILLEALVVREQLDQPPLDQVLHDMELRQPHDTEIGPREFE